MTCLFDTLIYLKTMTTMALPNACIVPHNYHFLFGVRTFQSYSLRNFQVNNMVSLAIIKSPRGIRGLQNLSYSWNFVPLANISHSHVPQPLATTILTLPQRVQLLSASTPFLLPHNGHLYHPLDIRLGPVACFGDGMWVKGEQALSLRCFSLPQKYQHGLSRLLPQGGKKTAKKHCPRCPINHAEPHLTHR